MVALAHSLQYSVYWAKSRKCFFIGGLVGCPRVGWFLSKNYQRTATQSSFTWYTGSQVFCCVLNVIYWQYNVMEQFSLNWVCPLVQRGISVSNSQSLGKLAQTKLHLMNYVLIDIWLWVKLQSDFSFKTHLHSRCKCICLQVFPHPYMCLWLINMKGIWLSCGICGPRELSWNIKATL